MKPPLKFKKTFWALLYVTLACILPLTFIYFWNYRSLISNPVIQYRSSNFLQENVQILNKNVSSYTIFTTGCKIPYMATYNEVVKPLIKIENFTEVQLSCGKLPMLTNLTEENDIILIEKSLRAYGVASVSSFRCCITEILRDKDGKDNDEYRYSTRICVDIDLPYHVTQDYVRIQCFSDDTLIYTDFYAAIQVKPDLEKRCEYMDNISPSNISTSKQKLSVVVFTLDSVSRLNFHRQMKKSSAFIKRTMKGIEMLGYNKLGDNTFPILVSILAGMSETEVQASCGGPYDDCPLIWKNFANNGYRTAYGEDSYIISTFNSLRKGFHQQPTDYYIRPLFSAEYRSVPRRSWNQHDYECFANRVQVPVLFNWTRDFVLNMKDKLHFGYFHTSGLTHDDLNWAQFVDPMLFDLLQQAFHSGSFNNTIFILMSDHGMRFGPIRQTYFGKLEESLPLLIFTFPEWFRKSHPSIIRQLEVNSRRLTSSFDIHETLMGVLNGDFTVQPKQFSPGLLPRGISLFKEVPDWRTCKDAQIPSHWCACHSITHGDLHSQKSITAANTVLSLINTLTAAKRSMCAKFSLKSLNRVDISKPTALLGDNKYGDETEDYTVVIVTNPGSAEFEGTVRFMGNTIVDVLKDVSRVNRYNNESFCIHDNPALKKFCYCIDNKC